MSAVSAARDANADNPAEKTGAVAKCPDNRAVLSRLHILRGEDRIGWLPFLDTYRTMCCAPEPAFRRILEDIRI
jgi:hypothetical protein